MKPPIINLDSIEKESIGNGGVFSAKIGKISETFGMKGIGCKLVELEPGEKAWPYHLHYGHEEMFVILEGAGTLRYDGAKYEVKSGDVVYAPPGEETAHQIINTSSGILRYLALSTKENPETCYYPDSGKYASYVWDEDGQRSVFIGHESDAKPYYDGEDGES